MARPCCPPTQVAIASAPPPTARMPAVRLRCRRATVLVMSALLVRAEDQLDGRVEGPGDREGKRQRGEIAARLDRVDGLAGAPELGAELSLGEPAGGAQLAYPVLHDD